MSIQSRILIGTALFCGLAALAGADTLTLRDGQVVRGIFLGGTARQIRMDLNGDIRTYDVGQVQSLSFQDGGYQSQPQSSAYPPPAGDPRMRRAPGSDGDGRADGRGDARSYDAPREQARGGGFNIPVDTEITVRMIDPVDSERARLGETFRASIDEPVVVNGREVIPRGADVLTKLVTDQRSGSLQGGTVLTLAISTITIGGRPVDVNSTDVQTASASRGARTAGAVGGGAALGAIIGAIAGGGKGAAIGAGSGAALGAGAQVLTGGQKVKIPSETRLTFRLQNPIQL